MGADHEEKTKVRLVELASSTRESGIFGKRSRVSEREKFGFHLKAAKAAFYILCAEHVR